VLTVLSAMGFLGTAGGPLAFFGEDAGRSGCSSLTEFSVPSLTFGLGTMEGGENTDPLAANFSASAGESGATGDIKPSGGDPVRSSDGR